MSNKLSISSAYVNDSKQLALPFPIQSAPPIVRTHGLQDTHTRPLVARDKGESFRVSPLQAWHFRLLEIRAGNSYPLLTLDCDGQESVQAFWLAQLNSELPEPNWVVQNPQTGNIQPSWCLANPVHRGETARAKPLHLLARTSEYYRAICEADSGFVGCLQRNPVFEQHTTWWGRKEPYHLVELAECMPAGWKIPNLPQTAAGRNDGLFRWLCSFVGTPRNYHVSLSELGAIADMKNQGFTLEGQLPLDTAEVQGIVRSVYKRHQQKLGTGEQQRMFACIQKNRGKKSGHARRTKTADRDTAIIQAVQAGQSMRAVGRQYGLRLSTVQNIIKRGDRRTIPGSVLIKA